MGSLRPILFLGAILQATSCSVHGVSNVGALSDAALLDRAPAILRDYNVVVLDRASDSATVQMDGWLIQTGQFELYARRRDIGRRMDRTCVDGMFEPDDVRVHAGSLQARHVRIVGRLALARYLDQLPVGAESLVNNNCGADFLLYGQSVEVLDK